MILFPSDHLSCTSPLQKRASHRARVDEQKMLSLRASHDLVFSDESIPVLEEEGNRLETVGDETGVGVFWKGRHTQMETRKDDSPERRFFTDKRESERVILPTRRRHKRREQGSFPNGGHPRDGLLAGQANPSWRALTMTCDRSRAPNL